MRHLGNHDIHMHYFIRTWYCVKLNPQMNSQKMHSSSYGNAAQQSFIGTGHGAVPTCPFLCLPAQSKARAAVLKDANDFLLLNAVNANVPTFMRSRKTVEEKSSWAFYYTVKQRAQVSQEWQKKYCQVQRTRQRLPNLIGSSSRDYHMNYYAV